MISSEQFRSPPRTCNPEGGPRTVGLEIEFAGVGVLQSAKIIQSVFGGTIVEETAFRCRVDATPFGAFGVEIDTSILTEKKYQEVLTSAGISPAVIASKTVEKSLTSIFSTLVPFEISTAPIPLDRLQQLDELRERLRLAGAEGTRAALLYAFGLHLNPQVPSYDAADIRSYLRAFILLYPWLKKRLEINIARRVSPFIDPFPEAYSDLIMLEDYRPALKELIADYLRHNPTRNRAFDMLPLFAFLDPEQLATVDLNKVKPRPTFHYRMPNSLVDDPTWRIRNEWNIWLEVEALAASPERIASLAAAYRETKASTLQLFWDHWPRVLEERMMTER